MQQQLFFTSHGIGQDTQCNLVISNHRTFQEFRSVVSKSAKVKSNSVVQRLYLFYFIVETWRLFFHGIKTETRREKTLTSKLFTPAIFPFQNEQGQQRPNNPQTNKKKLKMKYPSLVFTTSTLLAIHRQSQSKKKKKAWLGRWIVEQKKIHRHEGFKTTEVIIIRALVIFEHEKSWVLKYSTWNSHQCMGAALCHLRCFQCRFSR